DKTACCASPGDDAHDTSADLLFSARHRRILDTPILRRRESVLSSRHFARDANTAHQRLLRDVGRSARRARAETKEQAKNEKGKTTKQLRENYFPILGPALALPLAA